MRTLTWPQVWAWRLARHFLLERAPAAQLAEVVGAVCGIQAQVMPAAELGLGIRVAGVTRRTVQAALWEQRTLVKTYGLRGTIHLFPAAELPLWMAALRGRGGTDPKRLAELGVDATQFAALVQAIGDVLDGWGLTTRQLGDAVVGQVGAWAGETVGQAWAGGWPRWRLALGAAATAGRLCYGPPAGATVTYVRPDQWFGTPWREEDPDIALAEVFRRYLHAYGPATPRDFAQWFSVALPLAKKIANGLGDEVAEVEVEGTRALLLATDAAEVWPPLPEVSVRLLPHFDCYVIGCHPRDQLLPSTWTTHVPPRTRPSQLPTLLVDGIVVGVWERKGTGRRLAVNVAPFAPLTAAQERLLEAEATRVGEVFEAEATLTVGPITVRPHL